MTITTAKISTTTAGVVPNITVVPATKADRRGSIRRKTDRIRLKGSLILLRVSILRRDSLTPRRVSIRNILKVSLIPLRDSMPRNIRLMAARA